MMQVKIYTISAGGDEEGEVLLNRFLRTNRVLQLDRFFSAENGGYWTFCVTYIDSIGKDKSSGSGLKKDYKNELTEEQFARFTRFREIRRELSGLEGIPAYAVFTDEELAQICRLQEITQESMQKLKGVGEKKITRYGSYFTGENETRKKFMGEDSGS